jgi:hypothetical protein
LIRSSTDKRRASVPRRPERRASRWDLAAPLIVAIAAIVPYIPALSYQFLNWDDNVYVLGNPWIRAWSGENLVHVFTQPYYANFLPLHLVSYMVDYSLWGLNPFGYHLQSILLHALNAVLAMLVVRRMLGSSTVALLAALLFAVHPSHVEAVAWISIRKDLLSTMFALLTLYFYVRATSTTSIRWASYAASVVFFTLGLLSKVSIVTLPLFLLLLDRFKPGGQPRNPWLKDLASKIPYALAGLWLVWWNTLAQTKASAPYARDAMGYAMVKGHAVWNYLGLLAGVLRGSPDYDLPVLGKDIVSVLVSIAGLVILPAAAWIAYRFRNRPAFLGIAWIFIALLPALAFPLVTYMADRYLYAPSLGFCWLVAAAIVSLSGRVTQPRLRAAAAVGISLILLAGFAARTRQSLPVWRDSESLWTYALTRCQDFRAYTNLAEVRLGQKRWDEAERLLRLSARVENPTTYQNFAVLYYELGRYPEALDAMNRALAILRQQGWDPGQASALYYNLGAIYWKLGQANKTIEALEASLREDPSNEQAREQMRLARESLSKPAN